MMKFTITERAIVPPATSVTDLFQSPGRTRFIWTSRKPRSQENTRRKKTFSWVPGFLLQTEMSRVFFHPLARIHPTIPLKIFCRGAHRALTQSLCLSSLSSVPHTLFSSKRDLFGSVLVVAFGKIEFHVGE